jgi:probable F420-dependent oxidoreductase
VLRGDEPVKHGVTIFPTMRTGDVLALAREAEDLGFESFFVPEHTHIPVDGTPYPGGGEIPAPYVEAYAPLITLSAVAAVTTNLRVGTGICQVAQRDPILVAKEVATLDVLSGGRFVFGVGAGWNVAELENHGTRASERWRVLDERIEAMKVMWRDAEAQFQGDHVRFDPIRLEPKPLQRPHPPILVAGQTEGSMRRAVRIGDAWLPRARRNMDRVREEVARFREIAAEAGRPELTVTVYEARSEPEYLELYAELEIDRCVFMLPSAEPDEVRRALHAYAAAGPQGG